jgi:hypothetical protein
MKIQGAFRKELIGGGLALVLAVAYWIGANHIHKSSLIGKGGGAAARPHALGGARGVLALMLIAQSIIQHRRGLLSGAPAKPEKLAEARHKHLRAGGMFLIGVGFLAVVGLIGYIPAIFLMICVTAVYNGRPMSWRIAGLAALLTAVFYGLFDLILHIPMPAGIWPTIWRSIAG